MKYEQLGYMHIFNNETNNNNKIRKIHETTVLWKRMGQQGKKIKATEPQSCKMRQTKADLTRIVLCALEKNG